MQLSTPQLAPQRSSVPTGQRRLIAMQMFCSASARTRRQTLSGPQSRTLLPPGDRLRDSAEDTLEEEILLEDELVLRELELEGLVLRELALEELVWREL